MYYIFLFLNRKMGLFITIYSQAEGEVEEEDDDREDDTEIVKPSPVAPSNVEYDAETQALIDGNFVKVDSVLNRY